MKKYDYEKKKHRIMIADMIKLEKFKIVAEIGIERCKMTRGVLKQCDKLINQYWAIDIFEPSDSHERYYESNISLKRWKELYIYACHLMIFFPQLYVLKMSSLKAATLFPDQYFDLVFIDADHHYETTKADIKAWWPKIKKGGVLSGHDYSLNVTKRTHHKGVTQAVDEIFGNKKFIIGEKVWVKEMV